MSLGSGRYRPSLNKLGTGAAGGDELLGAGGSLDLGPGTASRVQGRHDLQPIRNVIRALRLLADRLVSFRNGWFLEAKLLTARCFNGFLNKTLLRPIA